MQATTASTAPDPTSCADTMAKRGHLRATSRASATPKTFVHSNMHKSRGRKAKAPSNLPPSHPLAVISQTETAVLSEAPTKKPALTPYRGDCFRSEGHGSQKCRHSTQFASQGTRCNLGSRRNDAFRLENGRTSDRRPDESTDENCRLRPSAPFPQPSFAQSAMMMLWAPLWSPSHARHGSRKKIFCDFGRIRGRRLTTRTFTSLTMPSTLLFLLHS